MSSMNTRNPGAGATQRYASRMRLHLTPILLAVAVAAGAFGAAAEDTPLFHFATVLESPSPDMPLSY